MLRIRTYESFINCMEIVVKQNFYSTLYPQAYKEAWKRIHVLQNFYPDDYNAWLERWKQERKGYV